VFGASAKAVSIFDFCVTLYVCYRQLGQTRADLLPWAWAINGCASVVAGPLATLLALGAGLPTVLLVASACYAVAALLAGTWQKDADLIIEPDIACFGYDDFARAADLVRVGEKATREVLPQIKQWLEAPVPTAAPSMNLRPATSGTGPLQNPLTAK